jgi:hypothetical protein
MYEFSGGHEKPLSPYEVLESGQELLQHFGVEVNPVENPEEFLEAIKQLDPRFQGERSLSRQDLEQDATEWPEDTIALITQAAEAMRMVALDERSRPISNETPLVGHYDLVIALGAARQANLDRTRYAVDCAKGNRESTSFKQLVVAGSSRRLGEAEQANTTNYAPGAQTEFDLCVGAAKTVAEENPGLIVSLSYEPDPKAGTPDVIDNVLDAMVKNEAVIYGETTVAAVTTQIYQVSTQMDLERVAKRFGITDVYVAGNPSHPELIAKRTPATYLTEIVRTLKAATLLVQAEGE